MRRPKKTVTINLADYLSEGTYNVKVKSKGTDIRDSADSNSVECVVAASGYSGRIIAWETHKVALNYFMFLSTKIKFDTAPTSESDYDTYCDENGNITGSTTFSNKTKVYVWTNDADCSGVKINNVETLGGTNSSGYTGKLVEIALTGNYDIYLAHFFVRINN